MVSQQIWDLFGDHLEEAWEVAGAYELRLLNTDVTLIVRRLLTGHNVGKYLAHASHGVASNQTGPYQSSTLCNTLEECVKDWVIGIRTFAGNPGAKMVPAGDA